jgi:hypothetical protein
LPLAALGQTTPPDARARCPTAPRRCQARQAEAIPRDREADYVTRSTRLLRLPTRSSTDEIAIARLLQTIAGQTGGRRHPLGRRLTDYWREGGPRRSAEYLAFLTRTPISQPRLLSGGWKKLFRRVAHRRIATHFGALRAPPAGCLASKNPAHGEKDNKGAAAKFWRERDLRRSRAGFSPASPL